MKHKMVTFNNLTRVFLLIGLLFISVQQSFSQASEEPELDRLVVLSKELYTGDVITYYPNGNFREMGKMKDGMKTGKWVTYYENGQKEKEGRYRVENVLRVIRPDGDHMFDSRSIEKGKWAYWDDNGVVLDRASYFHEKFIVAISGTYRYTYNSSKLEHRLKLNKNRTAEFITQVKGGRKEVSEAGTWDLNEDTIIVHYFPHQSPLKDEIGEAIPASTMGQKMLRYTFNEQRDHLVGLGKNKFTHYRKVKEAPVEKQLQAEDANTRPGDVVNENSAKALPGSNQQHNQGTKKAPPGGVNDQVHNRAGSKGSASVFSGDGVSQQEKSKMLRPDHASSIVPNLARQSNAVNKLSDQELEAFESVSDPHEDPMVNMGVIMDRNQTSIIKMGEESTAGNTKSNAVIASQPMVSGISQNQSIVSSSGPAGISEPIRTAPVTRFQPVVVRPNQPNQNLSTASTAATQVKSMPVQASAPATTKPTTQSAIQPKTIELTVVEHPPVSSSDNRTRRAADEAMNPIVSKQTNTTTPKPAPVNVRSEDKAGRIEERQVQPVFIQNRSELAMNSEEAETEKPRELPISQMSYPAEIIEYKKVDGLLLEQINGIAMFTFPEFALSIPEFYGLLLDVPGAAANSFNIKMSPKDSYNQFELMFADINFKPTKVSVRYEKTLTLKANNDRLELTHWRKHRTSEMKLKKSGKSSFSFSFDPSGADWEPFPYYEDPELVEAVEKYGTDKWVRLVKDTKSQDYLAMWNISQVFMMLEGKDNSGNVVTKELVLHLPAQL